MARGFKVLKGIVIYGEDNEDVREIVNFAESIKVMDLLVRTDREDETGKYPRGGFILPLKGLERFLEDRVDPRRYYFFLEPAHPTEDVYSINSAAWPDDNFVVHEIVGPGFDSGDLKRGNEDPHERFLVKKGLHISPQDVLSHSIVSPASFAASWRRRMVNVGSTVLPAVIDSGEDGLELVRRALQARGSWLLLSAEAGYQPIGLDRLQEVQRSVMRLCSLLPEGEFPGEPLVLSSAFLAGEPQLLHWDIVWPRLKYEGVTK